MQDAIVIAWFVLILVALAVASFRYAPDEDTVEDPWTAPWAA
jgi:hypothetical protein